MSRTPALQTGGSPRSTGAGLGIPRGIPCTVCGKAFLNNAELERHMRMHLDLRPYQCMICDRTFRQSSHALQHVRKVHRVEDAPNHVRRDLELT